MSILGAVDDALRSSRIGRFLPLLKRQPHLYRVVQGLRDLLLPRRSAFGLERYQIRAVERFAALTRLRLSTSTILEVGSDTGGMVLRELTHRGARRAIGINLCVERTQREILPPGNLLLKADARAVPLGDASIPAVFSVAALEHVSNLEQFMGEMYRILVPGGWLYADFNPIWSSSVGHHVCAIVDGEEARHWKPETNPVPDFAHLLCSAQELEAQLRGRVSDKLAAAIVDWIYRGDAVNRMFYEDYLRVFEASPLPLVRIDRTEEHVPRGTMAALRAKYPGYTRFDVRGVQTLFRKPEVPS